MLNRFLIVALSLSAPAWAQSVIVDNGASEVVGVGAQLVPSPGGVEVRGTGTFSVIGTSASSQARFLGAVGINIEVKTGGTIDFKFAKFENLSTLRIYRTGKVTRLHDTVFQDLADFPGKDLAWIDLCDLVATDRPYIPFSFNRVTFATSGCSGDGRVNVDAGSTTPIVRMLGNATTHGSQWGVSSEHDPYNRIFWHTGGFTRTSPSGAFDTIEEALADGSTTASSTINVTLGPNAFIDQAVDWNNHSYSSGSGPTIQNACIAPMMGPAIQDIDGDSTRRGIFVNCVIARGNVSETTANNCTFYDPDAALTISNVAGNNDLIESDASLSGNAFTSQVTTAASTWFVSASGYEFHLVSPAGNAAINTGSGSTPTTDWEGEPRPLGAALDVGADEYGQPVVITASRKTRTMVQPVIQIVAPPGSTVHFYRNGVWQFSGVVDSSGIITWTDTTAIEGVQYTYQGSLLGDGTGLTGSSAIITVDTTVPAAPMNCRVTGYNNCVDVEWDASASTDVVGYRVSRSTNGVDYAVIHTGVVVGTKYRDTTATNGTQYWYKVTALDDALNY